MSKLKAAEIERLRSNPLIDLCCNYCKIHFRERDARTEKGGFWYHQVCDLRAEIEKLRTSIDRLNHPRCAYCNFGDDVLATVAQFQQHVVACPYNPLVAQIETLKAEKWAKAARAVDRICELLDDLDWVWGENRNGERCRLISRAEFSKAIRGMQEKEYEA